jgi:glycosyltransferase involved in cell wall biosynthesis
VVSSRRESFSAVAVEALACGTPVVATRCGGPEEILTQETGVLVPPEDPEALAAGIDEVLSRRDEFEAQVLRARALEISGPPAVRRRIEELYRDVLTGDAGA